MFDFTSPSSTRGEFVDSLPNKIAKHLLIKIFSGELSPGDRLIEADIAKELKVSHAPVREALYVLQTDGVVERIPRKGVRVKMISKKDIDDSMEALIGLLHLVFDMIKHHWTDQNSKQLNIYFLEAEEEQTNEDVFEYVKKISHLLSYLFQVADNGAYMRFFQEITFLTSVVSQTRWNQEKVKKYHFLMKQTVEAVSQLDFDHAKKLIAKTLQSTFTPTK